RLPFDTRRAEDRHPVALLLRGPEPGEVVDHLPQPEDGVDDDLPHAVLVGQRDDMLRRRGSRLAGRGGVLLLAHELLLTRGRLGWWWAWRPGCWRRPPRSTASR